MSLFNFKYLWTVTESVAETIAHYFGYNKRNILNLIECIFEYPRAIKQTPSQKAHRGFTLIELMIVIAIVAILSAIAAPSFRDMIARNGLESATQDLRTALRFARSEAISTGQEIDVCSPNGDINNATTCPGGGGQDWSRGFIVFNTATNEVLSRVSLGDGAAVDIESDWTSLTFGANGFIDDAPGEIGVLSTRINAQRAVDVYASGLTELK